MTSKDFDTDTETGRGKRLALAHEFTLGGETFRLRNGLKVGSTTLDEWRGILGRFLADEETQAAAGHVEVTDEEFMRVWRSTMAGILVPGQEAALDRVLNNEEAPITIGDAFDVCFWSVGQVTGRPTVASQPSSNGSTPPTTTPAASSSTDASSSPAAAESKASA